MSRLEADDHDDETRDSDPQVAANQLDAGLEVAFRSDGPMSLADTVDQTKGQVGAGNLLANRYKLSEAIGEGGMGSVWLAEQKRNRSRKKLGMQDSRRFCIVPEWTIEIESFRNFASL